MRSQTLNHPIHFLLLMRFHKPIGIFLLLWPTLWALWIAAKGTPPLFLLFIFIAGTIVMRAAGCVINDIIDRKIDLNVSRTKDRPITSGRLSVKAALILLGFLYFAALLLVGLLNPFTIKLAIAAVILASIYPFAKRFTHWPQLILGFAFSWGILMAFAAITNTLPLSAWLLFLASVLWTITYDTEYAMTDRDDDLKIGVKSTAILFGKHDRFIIALLQSAMLTVLIYLGIYLKLHWVYFLSLGVAAIIFIYHQKLIAQRNPQSCLRAFLNNNWVGLVIFLGILLS